MSQKEIQYSKIIHAQFVLGANPPISNNLDLTTPFAADALKIRSCCYKASGAGEVKMGNVILPCIGSAANPLCAFVDGISIENGQMIYFPGGRTFSNETITFANVPITDTTARAGTVSLCLEFIKFKS